MSSKTIDLSPARWSRVEELFDQASGLDELARITFLESACGDDAELRDYVFTLLDFDPTIHESIEKTIGKTIVNSMNLAFGDDAAQEDQFKGEMIGPYRVERLIGSGGMGVVYLAERADEQFDQQVAIKLGRHRLVDPQTEHRLRSERQILSDLDHPNIARLFDGGTTKEGVPYLVMEHIDGIRIDDYCDDNRLDVVSRLQMFQTICAAVHHAHENLIIHRDIKAANILVTRDGIPKLLDFGIAKLTDTQGTATDGLTREGAAIMTPASAAPEQLLGNAVTTATDTYALGKLLYQLLAGVPAHPIDDMSPSEAARTICFVDATRPSLRLEQEKQAARSGGDPDALLAFERIASDRRTNPERLQRRLRGDLDTVILNALRKEPERRYRSVTALAADIGLHLKSMPIVARADSWRYRSGKFVRRHYAAVPASVLVVATLAAFTVLLIVQNRNIVKERDTAQAVSQFLEDSFNAADPEQALGVEITAKQILAAGADRIRHDLDDRPEIQSALMGTIGRVYFNLDDLPSSADFLQQALLLREQTEDESQPSIAAAKYDLARTLIQRGDFERAEELLTSSLQIYQKSGESKSQEKIVEILFNLAELHIHTGELDEAGAFATSSIEIYAQMDDQSALNFARAKATLARILQLLGDLDRSETLLREAINIVMASKGDSHPDIAFHLQNLSMLQRAKGDLDAAGKTLDRALDITRRILGDKHRLLAMTLEDQGTLLHRNGDYDNAERLLRESLALYIESQGATHHRVGYNMTALGMLLHDKTELIAAEDMLRHALSIFEQTLGKDHQYTASALTELGAVLNATGRIAEAETLLERALTIRVKDYPADHQLVAATRTEYADTLSRLGRFEEAEPLLLESVAALEDKPGRRRQRATDALNRLHDMAGHAAAE